MGFSPTTNADGSPNLNAAVEQFTMIAAAYWNKPDQVDAALVALGGGRQLAFQFNDVSLPPSWCITRIDNTVSIAFTGTVNHQQIFGDFFGAFAGLGAPDSAVQHRFFARMWSDLRATIIGNLPDDVASCTVIVTGHSYGAAVGFFAACDLVKSQLGQTVEYLGFTPPKCLTEGFAGPFPAKMTFLAPALDCIPFLPPTDLVSQLVRINQPFLLGIPVNWTHYATGYTMDDWGQVQKQDNAYWDATPTPSLIAATVTRHPPKDTADILLLAFEHGVGVGNASPVVPILRRITGLPNPQNDEPAVVPSSYADIPYQNTEIFFRSPDFPLTRDNFVTTNNVSASLSAATGTNPILRGVLGGNTMADSKVTFFFHTGVQGHSESYYIPGYDPNDVVDTQLQNYLTRRLNASGTNTQFDYARVSSVQNPRLVRVYYPQDLRLTLPALGTYASGTSGGQDEGSDTPDAAIIVRRINGANFSLQYFRGYPDSQVWKGGQFAPTAQYKTVLQNIFNYVVAQGWCWKAVFRTGVVKQLISAIAVNNDGTGTFTLAADLFPPQLIGKRVTVRINRINSPKHLNGPLTVTVVTTKTCVSLNQIQAAGFVPNVGQMVYSPQVLMPIIFYQIEKSGERKAGRPFGVPRGRQPNRGVR